MLLQLLGAGSLGVEQVYLRRMSSFEIQIHDATAAGGGRLDIGHVYLRRMSSFRFV